MDTQRTKDNSRNALSESRWEWYYREVHGIYKILIWKNGYAYQ